MKYDVGSGRNSYPVYDNRLSLPDANLPATHRRVIGGLEVHQNVSRREEERLSFETAHRHYGMICRAVSAQPVTLDEALTPMIMGGLSLGVERDEQTSWWEGIPIPAKDTVFSVERYADCFSGGELVQLSPGAYKVESIFKNQAKGQIVMELERDGATQAAVIGLFHAIRSPACIDWRVLAINQARLR